MSNPQVKQLRLFDQVFSVIPSKKLSECLCEIATGKNRAGRKRRGREIGKESIRLMESEMELWTEMETTWVRKGF